MHKLIASTYKEFLLLTRDIGGLAILFLMPILLVITITTIQDGTFKIIKETKIPVLWVDQDQGKIAKTIYEGLANSQTLALIENTSEANAKELVFKGDYQLAIVIPKNLSIDLEQKVNENVEGIMAKFGLEADSVPQKKAEIAQKEVRLYFDPATQYAFKSSIKNGIDQMIAKVETQSIYEAFQEQLGEDSSQEFFDTESFISFKEIVPEGTTDALIPNSTQHNIPAWTLFAIFFIILPLSINMVKEKNQGTFVRLRTNPISYATVLGGKTLVYLGVSLIQFGLMLGIGVYLFPSIGLPKLDVSGKIALLFLVAFFAGLAAIGLGLLLGTIAKSQEQSAPFGATCVVILAALGGVWVPVFAMPSLMQTLSKLSPMNWGLEAFYGVFLRNVGLTELLPEITLLFLFFIATTILAIVYNNRKNTV
jgi:ABC-2 type transport system permease protein